MKQEKNVNLIVYLVYFVISLSIFFIFLKNPAFSLVDDGYSLLKGKTLLSEFSINNWKETAIESEIGRFRPVYIMFYALSYGLFGIDSIGMWLLEFFVIWSTMMVFYLLSKKITKNTLLSFFTPLVFLLMPAFSLNAFRLGTAEPRQLLFVLSSIYLFFNFIQAGNKRNLIASAAFLFLAVGTKETSILLIPAYVFLLLSRKFSNKSPILVLFVMFFFFGSLFWLLYLSLKNFMPESYSISNLNLNTFDILKKLKSILPTFARYYWPIFLGLLSFITRFLIAWINKTSSFFKKNWHQLALFLMLFESVFFILAWSFGFERYYYLTWAITLLVLIMEVSYWLKIVRKQTLSKLHSSGLLVVTSMVFLVLSIGYLSIFKKKFINFGTILQEDARIYKRSFDAFRVSNSIAENLLSNKKVENLYVMNNNYEVIYELGLYASQIKEREIRVINPNKDLSKKFKGYYFSENPYLDYLEDIESEKTLLVGRELDIKDNHDLSQRQILYPSQKFSSFSENQFWWVLDKYEKESK